MIMLLRNRPPLRVLARRFGIDPKTVAKWKKRSPVAYLSTGPQEPRSTVLSAEDEAIIVAFREMIKRKERFRAHAFEYACAPANIDHRATEPKHPWKGQVERMNRTIKDATFRRFHYDAHDQFRSPLADLVKASNFAKRLKTLKGLTP
jgi:hypothetical protein